MQLGKINDGHFTSYYRAIFRNYKADGMHDLKGVNTDICLALHFLTVDMIYH